MYRLSYSSMAKRSPGTDVVVILIFTEVRTTGISAIALSNIDDVVFLFLWLCTTFKSAVITRSPTWSFYAMI